MIYLSYRHIIINKSSFDYLNQINQTHIRNRRFSWKTKSSWMPRKENQRKNYPNKNCPTKNTRIKESPKNSWYSHKFCRCLVSFAHTYLIIERIVFILRILFSHDILSVQCLKCLFLLICTNIIWYTST